MKEFLFLGWAVVGLCINFGALIYTCLCFFGYFIVCTQINTNTVQYVYIYIEKKRNIIISSFSLLCMLEFSYMKL